MHCKVVCAQDKTLAVAPAQMAASLSETAALGARKALARCKWHQVNAAIQASAVQEAASKLPPQQALWHCQLSWALTGIFHTY